jgi:GNAT superfamily N-acetyltransferase
MSAAPLPIRVRRAVPADGGRLLELDRELARFEKLEPPGEAEGRRMLALIFDSRRLESIVAEVDDRIEGIALFYEGYSTFRARPFLYLEDLVISVSMRGRGVGEALMASLAREAVSRGALRIEWAVLDWNSGAIRFYERLGAVRHLEWLRYSLDEPEMKRLAATAID